MSGDRRKSDRDPPVEGVTMCGGDRPSAAYTPYEVYTDAGKRRRFTILDAHLKLLRNANVDWQSGEFGAPAIDCKRPYGNSSVYLDMMVILGIDLPTEDSELSPKLTAMLGSLHREMETVLQIVLAVGEFAAGDYVQEKECDRRSWRKA